MSHFLSFCVSICVSFCDCISYLYAGRKKEATEQATAKTTATAVATEQGAEEGEEEENNGGIPLTKRWTISVWCRGGAWVRKGNATLCQSTNGDKIICLDQLGRMGSLKAAVGLHYEGEDTPNALLLYQLQQHAPAPAALVHI